MFFQKAIFLISILCTHYKFKLCIYTGARLLIYTISNWQLTCRNMFLCIKNVVVFLKIKTFLQHQDQVWTRHTLATRRQASIQTEQIKLKLSLFQGVRS